MALQVNLPHHLRGSRGLPARAEGATHLPGQYWQTMTIRDHPRKPPPANGVAEAKIEKSPEKEIRVEREGEAGVKRKEKWKREQKSAGRKREPDEDPLPNRAAGRSRELLTLQDAERDARTKSRGEKLAVLVNGVNGEEDE